MRRLGIVFVVAVFAPSLALAWLAVRSLQNTQIVLERQEALIQQGVADTLSREVNLYLGELLRGFRLEVEFALVDQPPHELAAGFHERLRERWPWARVGFAVSLDGQILSPPAFASAETRRFRLDNDAFLSNRETVEVYWQNTDLTQTAGPQMLQTQDIPQPQPASTGLAPEPPAVPPALQQRAPLLPSGKNPKTRNVQPQQFQEAAAAATLNFSRLASSEAEFRQLIGDAQEGFVARFLQNKLNLMFWYRSAQDPGLVFGALVDLDRLTADLRELTNGLQEEAAPALMQNICVALLDDTGKPVAVTQPAFATDWKRPFAATEIGEILPHWEAGVYLLDPTQLVQTANLLRLTLGSLIGLLLLAIGAGGWLIVGGLKRELALARQKTDFVSNVSHELKTPLTSIRMFSELLAEGRVRDSSKQRHYLQIITAEAARLTRLINNVLDFSRMERGEKKYQFRRVDLAELVRETTGTYRPHLESNGFELECSFPAGPLWATADADAIAQVLVNLLSNAEKYSGDHRQIRVTTEQRQDPLPHAEIRVEDRGLGVPKGSETKIFEKFYRAHDSLSSGVQGSGLGLTLARQIARAHGGELGYEPRAGGGSVFILRLPCGRPETEAASVQTQHVL